MSPTPQEADITTQIISTIIPTIPVLIGVLAGYFLNHFLTKYLTERKYKKALKEELQVNLSIIPNKKDILEKILKGISERKLLSGESVSFHTLIYTNHYPSIIHNLNIKERNLLHVCYESMKVIDSIMHTYCNDIVHASTPDQQEYILRMYKAKLNDLLEQCSIITNLINSYFSQNPIDVFHMDN